VNEISRSRRTKSVHVDSEQFYRLMEVGQKIDVYRNQSQAQQDNYEQVLKVVIDEFEDKYE
jgi:hypothetical protein